MPSGNEDRSNGDWIATTLSTDVDSSNDKDFAQIFGSGKRKVLGEIVYQLKRKAIFSDGSFKLSPKEGAEVTGEWQQYPQFTRNDFVNSQDQGSYYSFNERMRIWTLEEKITDTGLEPGTILAPKYYNYPFDYE